MAVVRTMGIADTIRALIKRGPITTKRLCIEASIPQEDLEGYIIAGKINARLINGTWHDAEPKPEPKPARSPLLRGHVTNGIGGSHAAQV